MELWDGFSSQLSICHIHLGSRKRGFLQEILTKLLISEEGKMGKGLTPKTDVHDKLPILCISDFIPLISMPSSTPVQQSMHDGKKPHGIRVK